MLALAEKGMGRQEAHELLRRLSLEASSKGIGLREALLASKEVKQYLGEKEIDAILDPHKYIGTAVEQVERIVTLAKKEKAHRSS